MIVSRSSRRNYRRGIILPQPLKKNQKARFWLRVRANAIGGERLPMEVSWDKVLFKVSGTSEVMQELLILREAIFTHGGRQSFLRNRLANAVEKRALAKREI